ncbi:MAG: ABC transporter permease subunit [Dysgonamonadaceae bacterium]|jgi:phosphate transport system permease protein|nr:ABC transporter permease subunit [Dysgonamonadaceae bacterium]
MKLRNRTYPIIIDRAVKSLGWIFCIAALIPVFILLWKAFENGWKDFDSDLIMRPSPAGNDTLLAQIGETPGDRGILNGIYGTMFILFIGVIPAVLVGLLTGIYISDNRSSRFASFIRQINNLLHGAPSIIVGLTVYWWMVRPTNHFSALAGGISLAIILLPAIVNATIHTLEPLPKTLRESGLALGISYFNVVCQIVIPATSRRLLAAILSTVTRTLGTTSLFIVTAAGLDRMDWNIAEPANTVTVLIWNLFNNPSYVRLMWSAILCCLLIIILLHWITYLIYPLYDE